MSNLKLLDMSGLDNTTIPASCLANTNITTVLLPLNLTAIPSRAFYQAAITSIYIPETVQTIGEYAFYQCKSLKGNLVIPDATTSIGNLCFYECSFDGLLQLGIGLETIGVKAFTGCSGFTGNLIIPDNVRVLDEGAFAMSGFNGTLLIGNGISNISGYAFYKCSNLTQVTIGINVSTISQASFAYCNRLSGNLTIPDSVASIGAAAFYGCNKFTGSLILSSSLTKIGGWAFVSDKYQFSSGNYYASDPLNFQKIYSKAATPPTITESIYGVHDTKIDEFSLPFILKDDGSYTGLPQKGTFRGYKWGDRLPNLIIPTGSKGLYQDSDWANIFTLIEETDFE